MLNPKASQHFSSCIFARSHQFLPFRHFSNLCWLFFLKIKYEGSLLICLAKCLFTGSCRHLSRYNSIFWSGSKNVSDFIEKVMSIVNKEKLKQNNDRNFCDPTLDWLNDTELVMDDQQKFSELIALLVVQCEIEWVLPPVYMLIYLLPAHVFSKR